MKPLPILECLLFLAVSSTVAHGAESMLLADFTVDLSFQQDVDLGDISSDGLGGRQLLVSPVEPDDLLGGYRFFPPHNVFPELFPPTPATPSQESVVLAEGTLLKLAIPELAHFPLAANVEVSHELIGSQIIVHASIEHLPFGTDTIYGPHEFLYALGAFSAGDYRLTFNLNSSISGGNSVLRTGYVDFSVVSVPEPGGVLLVCFGCGISAVCGRRKIAK